MNAGLEYNPVRNREVSGADVGKQGTRKRILETGGCGCIGSFHNVPQPVADREVLFTNVGTGRGYSVLQIVCEFERISGRAVSRRIVERRPGDMAVCYADPGLARSALGWSVSLSLEECRDAWNRRQSSGRG